MDKRNHVQDAMNALREMRANQVQGLVRVEGEPFKLQYDEMQERIKELVQEAENVILWGVPKP